MELKQFDFLRKQALELSDCDTKIIQQKKSLWKTVLSSNTKSDSTITKKKTIMPDLYSLSRRVQENSNESRCALSIEITSTAEADLELQKNLQELSLTKMFRRSEG